MGQMTNGPTSQHVNIENVVYSSGVLKELNEIIEVPLENGKRL